ncbi:hypothetical protein R3P38DRAFT_2788158 [Favolaschia claudopus]|uniref:Uncharacterized protein n=1 Tax=Favolaschia claudopus TaxID=2862362 RepID=A0AAW0ALW6_9AGAR
MPPKRKKAPNSNAQYKPPKQPRIHQPVSTSAGFTQSLPPNSAQWMSPMDETALSARPRASGTISILRSTPGNSPALLQVLSPNILAFASGEYLTGRQCSLYRSRDGKKHIRRPIGQVSDTGDFRDVKWWTQKDYDKTPIIFLLSTLKTRTAGAKKYQGYQWVKNKAGVPLDKPQSKALAAHLRTALNFASNKRCAPSHWSEGDLEIVKYVRSEMYTAYLDLRLLPPPSMTNTLRPIAPTTVTKPTPKPTFKHQQQLEKWCLGHESPTTHRNSAWADLLQRIYHCTQLARKGTKAILCIQDYLAARPGQKSTAREFKGYWGLTAVQKEPFAKRNKAANAEKKAGKNVKYLNKIVLNTIFSLGWTKFEQAYTALSAWKCMHFTSSMNWDAEDSEEHTYALIERGTSYV